MRRLIAILGVAIVLAWPLSAAPVNGTSIHWSSAGAGKTTMVFVHGWTCDSSSWAAQVPAFSKTHRVITLDLPGHGQSPPPADGRFSMDVFAEAVEAVRVEAKADSLVLVGHSMGAPVIRQYALRYPQHVAALVAVDGSLDMRRFGAPRVPAPPPLSGAAGLKMRETMIHGMFTPQTPAALQQRILAMMLRTPEPVAVGAMAAMFDRAILTDDVLAMPALTIYAGTSRLPDVDDMRKSLPRFEVAQIAGTGHFVMMERPDEFNRVLAAFLKRMAF